MLALYTGAGIGFLGSFLASTTGAGSTTGAAATTGAASTDLASTGAAASTFFSSASLAISGRTSFDSAGVTPVSVFHCASRPGQSCVASVISIPLEFNQSRKSGLPS